MLPGATEAVHSARRAMQRFSRVGQGPENSGKESLNGQIPAEARGIEVEGNNKWKTLIENAINTKKNISSY